MLTIDDCNTILEKYGHAGFWYEFDMSKIDATVDATYTYDFIEFHVRSGGSTGKYLEMNINNEFWNTTWYFTDSSGQLLTDYALIERTGDYDYAIVYDEDYRLFLYIGGDLDSLEFAGYPIGMYLPRSPLMIPVVNGEFDNKFYITPLQSYIAYTINGESVQAQQDDKGTFLTLPSSNNCILGRQAFKEGVLTNFELYSLIFREFKTIPNLSVPLLYKGTSQQVQLYNEDTEEYITEFQAYYQGRKLKDNIITLDYDVDDTVDIVVDILDPAYPQSRVKLKASTIYYVARTQAELETAITNGIKTVMVTNHQQPLTRAVNEYVLLTSMELTDLNLINSDIHLTDCTVDNVNIISTTFKDKGDNKFTDCKFQETTITSTGNPSKYNDCIITECTVTATELRLTGAITNTTLSNSLIISDGIIEVIDNTFTGKYSKDYFPSFLYLTGDYLAKNNSFTLSDTWTEPAFNMCIIKSIDSFNPSLFIAENTFNLNIVYDTEPTNTFYYNIVDDDKIKAKRLS